MPARSARSTRPTLLLARPRRGESLDPYLTENVQYNMLPGDRRRVPAAGGVGGRRAYEATVAADALAHVRVEPLVHKKEDAVAR